ncbi:DUF3231 family protein [Paenibacillus anseongense]|uniref:DUF3231 family protein n=1 Tax=Paenibacillus anseongense TaxID=2682845 RepID=UPI002DB92A31|nr:DUF3231 family protein [Paenibacillus anseongense]MEC0271311.1 DUF3231 family protein [Paenibacillus anseongense]
MNKKIYFGKSKKNIICEVWIMNVNELGFLWNLQKSSNMVNIFLKYLNETAEDRNLKNILSEICEVSTYQEQKAIEILSKNGFREVQFFSNDDVYNSNSKLFSDQLIIEILKHIVGLGIRELAAQYSDLTDVKVKRDFKEIFDRAIQIDLSLLNLLDEKGLLQDKTFSYKKPEKREGNFFKVAATQKRSLSAVELAYMFSSHQCNNVGIALCIGFSEVADDEDAKEFLLKGEKLAFNHSSKLTEIFRENGVPTTTGLEAHVNTVRDKPLSDKLMANLVMFLNPIGIMNLQSAIVVSYKKDHIKILKELIEEIEEFAETGFKLLVKKDWFKEPPMSIWSHKG